MLQQQSCCWDMERCPYSQCRGPGGFIAISRVTALSPQELLGSDQTMPSHPDVPLEQLHCTNFSKFWGESSLGMGICGVS